MNLTEQKMVLKPWGHEVVFAITKDYVGKVIHIKANHQLSLQFHKVKEKTLYLQSGELRLLMENPSGEMKEYLCKVGQSFHVPPNRKHRIIAQQDSVVFEVSTPYLDDIVRLEDNYGRVPESGSTS